MQFGGQAGLFFGKPPTHYPMKNNDLCRALTKSGVDSNPCSQMMQKFCKFRNLMHEPEMRLARSPILCSKLTMMTVLECQQGSKKSLLGPASTAFVCNVSEKGDRIHRCMHCSQRKDLRCMHSLVERRRPGHASLFDRGLVSPVRCRKHVLNYRGMLLMDAPNGCVDRNDCIRIDADVFAVLLCSCSLAEICNSSSLVR